MIFWNKYVRYVLNLFKKIDVCLKNNWQDESLLSICLDNDFVETWFSSSDRSIGLCSIKVDIQQSEGEAERYFEHAITLGNTLRFLRQNEAKKIQTCDGGVDLLRQERLQSLEHQARLRVRSSVDWLFLFLDTFNMLIHSKQFSHRFLIEVIVC